MPRDETNWGRGRCCEVLGVAPGAAEREIKAAYRDLAKVWHPDRFTHDPRLQQKAQEKLKEINEAYRQLTAAPPAQPRTARPAQTAERDAHAQPRHDARPSSDGARAARETAHAAREAARDEGAGRAVARGKFDWRLVVPALVFCATFAFFTPRLLSSDAAPGDGDASARQASDSRARESETNPAGQKDSRGGKSDEDASRSDDDASRSGEASRSRDAARARDGMRAEDGARSQEAARAASGASAEAGARKALPTVTVSVDPTTNLLARPGCPAKMAVTFPAGEEPRAHCDAAHARADSSASAQETGRNKSRLKSLAGRLASPSKWLDGRGPSDAPAKRPAAQAQSPERD